MNRSILIVICDFLLVSLLAFSTVDINKLTNQGLPTAVKIDMPSNHVDSSNRVDSNKDLAEVMRLALNDERKQRDQLLSELAKSRNALDQQQSRLDQQQSRLDQQQSRLDQQHALLVQRENQSRTLQQQLQTSEQQASLLQQAQLNLQSRYIDAQTNILSLSQQLHTNAIQSVLSKEKLAALEAELKKRSQEAAALGEQLTNLAQSNQVAQAEKQRLTTQLQVAETEKRYASERVARMTQEIQVEREEKAKLAEGVKTLATNSVQLAKEIRKAQPLTANAIFTKFLTNRVEASFTAFRTGLLGGTKQKDTETVLVTDGTNIFALCHIQDTPLALWNPGTDWDQLSGTLAHSTNAFPIPALCFQLQDPRIVFIPVPREEADALGCSVYPVSSDPYKFQDAVLVGAREGYYGECQFQIDVTTPGYVKLDRSFVRGLFGKFNPSRGDLVFSRDGELLGVMANSTYCLKLQNFTPAATFKFGQDVTAQHTGQVLSFLYTQVSQFPHRLE